jgi:hypothetical protein
MYEQKCESLACSGVIYLHAKLIQEYLHKYFELFDTHESSQSEKNGETLW